ncbi:MAG TPA: helix-turn-helix domain-containing protein [Miltoncostaeales bacterium]|nr:helix-turn-helix domain-containing protein [Miltoncostaeales bacterium]
MFAPPPDLADTVDCFWTGAWDLAGQEPHTVQLLGDPCVHIAMERGASRVVGVWTETWTRTLSGVGCVRAVKLRAGATQAVFDRPASTFTDRLVPLADALPTALSVEESVLDAPSHEEAARVLADWLRGVSAPVPDPKCMLAVSLMGTLAADRSIVRVEQLAAHAGLTVRALQRLFDEHVGASPKWAIRRHRLQEAAVRIEAGTQQSLARLAAELGYADQAHLARDFRNAVGTPPGAFGRDVHR